jgi:hypothetical protein
MANTITVELDLDTLTAQSKLKDFPKKAKDSGEKAGESFGKGFAQSLLGNIGADLFRDAFRGIANELGSIVSAGKSLEVIETQFQTLLKSSSAAQKQLEDLQAFAATTPFQLEGLSLATRQLLSFGTAQEDIIPTLRQLGDLAAGTGSRIDELTIPFGRLQSTQKLTLVELDKFADRGINLYGQLAKQTGISLKTIRDEISKGKVPFEEFTQALNTLTNEGGLFFNATQKQSKTLAGTLSTLGDNVFNLRANLGKLFSPIIIKVVNILTKSIQDLQKELSGITVEDAQQGLVRFNQGVIDYLIRPLELFANVGKVVFDGVNLALQGVVASLGFVGGKFAELLTKFGIDNELTQGLMAFKETSALVFDEFSRKADESVGGIFDTPIAEKAEEFNAQLSESLAQNEEVVSASTGKIGANVDKTFTKTLNTVDKTAKAMGSIVKNSLARGISQSIQTVVTAIGRGEDAFKAFGKVFLGVVGDLAIKLGETLILSGVGIESLKSLGGAAAIAAGAGLVAIGTIIKNAAGGGGSSGGGSGGDTAIPNDQALATERELTDEDEVEERRVGTTNNITIQGSLVQQEELGQFITDVQNETREKNGTFETNVRVV